MKISDVLRSKGTAVVSIGPDETVRQLLDTLARHRVGALIVSSEGMMHGIVSERDVVRRLHTDGDGVLDGPVRAIMTTVLHTADPQDTVDGLMRWGESRSDVARSSSIGWPGRLTTGVRIPPI